MFVILALAVAITPVQASDVAMTFGGNTPWFTQTAITHDGIGAFQSGSISHSQSSWMETTVTGPGAVRFWWKVSSESCCDPLSFTIDGISQTDIRGDIPWQRRAAAVPDGSHTLRWTYSTDSSVLTGANAGWVDQVTFEQGNNIDVTAPTTTVTPAGGIVTTPQMVTLTTSEPATIYYTTNGNDPTTESNRYTSPITISSTTTLKFMAVDSAGNYEVAQNATYEFVSISGKVTDSSTDSPLFGVYVSAYRADTGSWAGYAYTNDSGDYTISGLPTGVYMLRFSSPGYVSQWYNGTSIRSKATPFSVTASHSTNGINMVLTQGGSISGRITDRITGAGIPDIYLSAIDSSGNITGSNTSSNSSNGFTDENGYYTISGLASGSYRLRIDPAYDSDYIGRGYDNQEDVLCGDRVTVTAPAATTGIDIQLDRGGSISGRVTDASTSLAIPWLNISYSYTNSAQTGISISYSTALIDSSGTYIINGLPSGEYQLTFSASGYVRTTSAAITLTAPAVVTGIDAVLSRGGGISGRVTDSATGQGIADVMVSAWSGSYVSGISDANGNYHITGLASGNYILSFYPDTSSGSYFSAQYPRLAEAPVSVTAPEVTTGVDMALNPAGSISGRVIDRISNQPIRSTRVAAYDAITGTSIGSDSTDSNGDYTIRGVPNGIYRIQFRGTPFSCSMSPESYTETVSSTTCYPVTWYGGETGALTVREVVVRSPEAVTGIDAALASGGVIAGTITVATCPGPQQVTITAYDALTGDLAGQYSINTSYSDRFKTGPLPAGRYKLAVTLTGTGFLGQWYPNRPDFVSAGEIAVTVGQVTGGIQVHLAAGGGSIAGRAIDSAGRPLVLSVVKVFDWYSSAFVTETTTGIDGRYSIAGLRDGSYKLLREDYGGQPRIWYRAPGDTGDASPVVVSGGSPVIGIDFIATEPSGDLDNSGGSATLRDALLALKIALGLEAATPERLARGDIAPIVNGVSVPDGVIAIDDVIIILRRAVSQGDQPFVHGYY